ncbi:MAG: hypothetical protein JETCAE03_34020 [Ignavibacteriaceae bacterium]|jgi:CO dehydrogenase/acetyl-CoA synthase alpha subunit|nr:MAG: hypothetical protein JETCAE03_34020 [Ignavibacteriaceae bacterium]
MIKIDLKVGDTVLAGKWKNKKIVVKDIGEDEFGSPTVNGKSILKIRIPKLYQKESAMKLTDLIKEEKVSISDFKKALQYATETSPDKIKVLNFNPKIAKVHLPHAFYKEKLETYLNGTWKNKDFKVTDIKRATGIGSIYYIEIKDK